MSRCVITGVGLVTALGQTADETFENIRNGNSGIKPIKRISTEGCYTNLGAEVDSIKLTPAAGSCIYAHNGETLTYQDLSKPLWRINLSSSGEWNGKDHKYYHILGKALDDAINDAHIATSDIKETDVLLNATCSGDSDIATFRFDHESLYNTKDGSTLFNDITIDTLEGLKPTTMYFEWGRTTTISTACSSGTVALAHAANLIKIGKADRVIVMGADIISDVHFSGFLSLKALDDNPCHPFSDPKGLTLGDGAAAIVLESEETARARKEDWYCYVAGSALSSEANHITAPDSTGESQYRTMKNALADASVDVGYVDFIYTHGTGTPKNDEAESLAIEKLIEGKVDKYSGPYVGSSKSAVGHTLGASGLVNVVLASKMFQNQTLLPTVGFSGEGINKNIKYIGNFETLKNPRVILCNSFAFGGNDASLVLCSDSKSLEYEYEPINIEIIGYDLYTNQFKSEDDFIDIHVLPDANPVLPQPVDFTKDGISINNLRKMDLYSRVKSVSGIRALKNAGIEVTDDNRYKIAIVGGSEIGTPTPMNKDYCKKLAEDGNTWGDPTIFPNSVYNAGDGWLSINTGIKGPCISTIDSIDGIMAYYTIADTLLESHKADIVLLSYCDIMDNGITCMSIVLRKTTKEVKDNVNWREVSFGSPRPNQLMRKILINNKGKNGFRR